MLHKAVQIRLYPTALQEAHLAQTFGCSRWWWNYALNKSIQVYQDTGKGMGQVALNALLPKLKKAEDTIWLANCYSQVLQATTLNLTTAYKNFFEQRAGFPKFKSKHGKQSIQYPQNVKIVDGNVKLPGNIGIVKAKIHRPIAGKIKTVTVSKTPSGKYLASILTEIEGENPTISEGKIYGIDLGIKHFAVVTDGENVSKYDNPKHFAKHEKNLKRKQKKLARKQKGSKSRNKYRKIVAKLYERVSNSRQDFLHKLSHKLVSDSQAVIVENLHVKGMVRNHKLAKAISDCGWGTFSNLLAYKLERKGGKLVEIDRWFPSSKLCSNCFYKVNEMPLDVREWTCPNCGSDHDRDGNAAMNIRTEGIRMLKTDGSAVWRCRRRGKTKRGMQVRLEAFACEYRSRHCTWYSKSVSAVHTPYPMSYNLFPLPDPKVPTWRRCAALGVDFCLIGLFCAAVGAKGVTLFLLFMIGWLTCRVVVVSKNQGQSLGRWAFDIRVVDSQRNRTPRLLELVKREAFMGIGTFLLLLSLGSLTEGNAGILLLMLPILLDCGAMLFDTSRHPQTVHDRIGQTIVIGSRRGYSLDLKIRYLIDKVKREMRQ